MAPSLLRTPLIRYIALERCFKFTFSLEWLLHGFFHADGVHHPFEMLEDFRFMAGDELLAAAIPSCMLK
jgi:hypothetical protein